MLESFARHGFFDLEIEASGDLHIDDHHTVEDVGIVLGRAFRQALGDRAGIRRFGEAMVPLDEALCSAVVDISGARYLAYNVPIAQERVGNFQTELVHDFMKALSDEVGMNLHLNLIGGRNPHHVIEATFKALARAMDQATAREPRSAAARSRPKARFRRNRHACSTSSPSFHRSTSRAAKSCACWHGEMNRATVYGQDPAATARAFESEGARIIHVVDLDGAIAGTPRNLESIRAIRAAVGCALDVSGGLRTVESVRAAIAAGADYVSIGSAAMLNPPMLAAACREHPGRVFGSLDVREGRLAVKGWRETSQLVVADALERFQQAGVAAVILTDISRDGTEIGIDIEMYETIARSSETPVIASGGVARIEDVVALSRLFQHGIAGVITGRALYEGRFTLSQAIAATI